MITDLQREKIYRDYHGKVCGYIRSRTNGMQDAEDIAANVFVKVFERLDSFDESKASLSTWIYTITRNTMTDWLRTRKVFDEVPETLDDGSSVEDEICNGEMLEKLADALSALPERERTIIILHYYSGKTLKETADRLSISYSHVKSLKNKALLTMKKYLE